MNCKSNRDLFAAVNTIREKGGILAASLILFKSHLSQSRRSSQIRRKVQLVVGKICSLEILQDCSAKFSSVPFFFFLHLHLACELPSTPEHPDMSSHDVLARSRDRANVAAGNEDFSRSSSSGIFFLLWCALLVMPAVLSL